MQTIHKTKTTTTQLVPLTQLRSACVCTFNPRPISVILNIVALVVLHFVLGTHAVHGQQPDISRLEWNSSAIDRIANPTPPTHSPTSHAEARYDDQVVPTTFERAPNRLSQNEAWDDDDVARIQTAGQATAAAKPERMNFMQRERATSASATDSDGTPNKESIGPMIANIGMNLAIVLFIGTGVVVLAKQWINPQAKPTTSSASQSLHVKEVLMLDAKSKLQVIQWQSTHVLVASDSQGIRSVVPLMPTFSETMDAVEPDFSETVSRPEQTSYRAPLQSPATAEATPAKVQTAARTSAKTNEPPSAIDDRLIQMLLNSANRSKPTKGYQAEGSA